MTVYSPSIHQKHQINDNIHKVHKDKIINQTLLVSLFDEHLLTNMDDNTFQWPQSATALLIEQNVFTNNAHLS